MTDGSQHHFDAEYYEGNSQSGDRIALSFYARLAARLAPAGSRVLEYGSGEGHLSRRLAARYRSSAYDLSPYARATTARNAPHTRIVGDPEAIAPGSFDVICCLHVLEHIPVPGDTLGDFARWLRPGGRLMYVVPNPQGLGHRIKGRRWFAYRDDTHCSLLSAGEWLGETRDAGFAIDRVAADGLWDPPYVSWLPRPLQLGLFGAPAAVQVALGRAVLPAASGECIIVIAHRS